MLVCIPRAVHAPALEEALGIPGRGGRQRRGAELGHRRGRLRLEVRADLASRGGQEDRQDWKRAAEGGAGEAHELSTLQERSCLKEICPAGAILTTGQEAIVGAIHEDSEDSNGSPGGKFAGRGKRLSRTELLLDPAPSNRPANRSIPIPEERRFSLGPPLGLD